MLRRLQTFRIGHNKVILKQLEPLNLFNPSEKRVRRNPKKSIKILAEELRVWYGTMPTLLRKDLKMSPFNHVKKQQLSVQVVDKRLQGSRIHLSRIQDGTLPNLIFSGEKKFDVEHHFNAQKNKGLVEGWR